MTRIRKGGEEEHTCAQCGSVEPEFGQGPHECRVDCVIFASVESSESIGRLRRGNAVVVSGTPVMVEGYTMVLISSPKVGAVELKHLMSHRRFRRCRRCKAVFYCGAACQQRHWDGGHRDVCIPAAQQ